MWHSIWLIEIRNFLDEFILKHRSLTTCPWKKSWLKRAFPFGSSLLNFRGVSLIQLAGSFLHPLNLWCADRNLEKLLRIGFAFTNSPNALIWACIIFTTAKHPPQKKGSIKPHDFSPQHVSFEEKTSKTYLQRFVPGKKMCDLKGDAVWPFSEFGDKQKGR